MEPGSGKRSHQLPRSNHNEAQGGHYNRDENEEQHGDQNRDQNEKQDGDQSEDQEEEDELFPGATDTEAQSGNQKEEDEVPLGDIHDEIECESGSEEKEIPLRNIHNEDQSDSENEGKELCFGNDVIIHMQYITGKGKGSPPGVLFASHTHPDGIDEGKPLYKDGVTKLLDNDEVICAVRLNDKIRVFHVITTANNKGEEAEPGPGGVYKFRADWKLDVVSSQADYMPPIFVRDNIISPHYPYLAPKLPYSDHTATPPIRRGPPTPRLYIIVSTKSGSCQAAAFYRQILQPFLVRGSDVEREHMCIMTSSPSTIKTFAQDTLYMYANIGKHQTVILISGDGGVVDLLNGLWCKPHTTQLWRSPTIGIIPMGTGNALATSVGLNRDKTLGLRRFCLGTPKPLPTFTVSFSPGSRLFPNNTADFPAIFNGCGIIRGGVVCSWALHASVVAESDTLAYRKHGNARFAMAAQELLRPGFGSPMHIYKGRLSYIPVDRDGNPSQVVRRVFPDLHSYLLLTLVSHLEPGFNISPKSRPLDGVLRLLRVAAPITADALEAVMIRAFTDGSHVDDPEVEYKDVSWCRIEIDELEQDEKFRRICVDGTIVEVPAGGWIEIKIDSVLESRLNIVA